MHAVLDAFITPVLDVINLGLAADTEVYKQYRPVDKWRQLYAGKDLNLKISHVVITDHILKNLHRDPDKTFTDFFFNGGNAYMVKKMKKLGELRHY